MLKSVNETLNPKLYVISTKRPQNVDRMLHLCSPEFEPTWVVGVGDYDDYYAAGAGEIIEVAGLCEARNVALDDAFKGGNDCVQLSDDLKKLQFTSDGKTKAPITLFSAVSMMREALLTQELRLAGVAPTDNAFYYNKPLGRKHFIVGDFIYVRPTHLGFDTQLKLKEDYDYTLQHLRYYGGVARVNGILATFEHKTNKGGAVDIRNEDTEQKAIGYLKMKWPGNIIDNPRRKQEVLLRWK